MKVGDNDVVCNGLPPSQGRSPSLLNRQIQAGQISFDKSSPSPSRTSISTGSKNLGSNSQGPKEDILKEEGITSGQILDDDSTKIEFDKCERITNLVAHCPWEFYFKKNNLKLDEQRDVEQFSLSSPERIQLDYCQKGQYIAVKLMCGRWRRALFVRKFPESYVKVFYLDYGVADEDVMEDQIYVLPED